MITQQNPDIEQSTISVKIIRANGRVEDYGIVAGFHKNKIKHVAMQISIYLRRFIKGLIYGFSSC